MKFLKIIFKLPLNLFLFAIYFLSGFFPRDKNIIVYGCPMNGFSDNAKYVYLYDSLEPENGITRYWITGDRSLIKEINSSENLIAIKRFSLRGVWLVLRAGIYIYSSYVSDICFWLSRNAKLINYWHGLPLKHIEFDIKKGKFKNRYNPTSVVDRIISIVYFIYHPAVFKRPDLLCSPVPLFDGIFMRAFRIKKESLFQSAYPRWRYITGDDRIDKILVENKISDSHWRHGEKLFLYLPTFRDANSRWAQHCVLQQLQEIDNILTKQRYYLLIKFHPNESIKDIITYKNIFFLDEKLDVYPLLRKADVVITDYSSVMIDAVVCKKNVALYWPDFSDYAEKSRDSYFDLKSIFIKKPILTTGEFKNIFIASGVDKFFVNEEIMDQIIMRQL